jgi:urease accessory protein
MQPSGIKLLRPSGWDAYLKLRFEDSGGKTLVADRSHVGPLRLLKPLYPEGEHVCHAIIVHPPGGIVADDHLRIDVSVGPKAHCLCTTPGAQKWYRSTGALATAHTRLRVGATGTLEWMPQETIVFDAARAQQSLHIEMDAAGKFFGWEILCLGRRERKERFASGLFSQRIELVRDDALIWSERLHLLGNDPLLSSPLGLAGCVVSATAILALPLNENTVMRTVLLPRIREILSTCEHAAASSPIDGLIVIKVVDTFAETVRNLLITVWSTLRLDAFQTPAEIPRIWST